ncbi:MAG: hypothetical protein JWM11_7235 [Planctomycetaceae bacterium]|nr:hypothetical protein [Planctomycetaceae bacterium]
MADLRESKFSHSPDFPSVLAEARGSLLVSTYQAGQVGTFGMHEGKLSIAMEPFTVAMGIAVHPRKIVVGSRGLLWQLESAGRELAQRIEPAGKYDAALLTRSAHVTGNIHSHELAFVGDELWMVNTLFSCLATIQSGYNFVPRWKPKFVSNCHVPGDRCHLNGLALSEGRIKYVTAMAESDTPNGWRAAKEKTGVLIDVASHEVVCRGFAMPHSPRVHLGQVWVLDSGRGQLVQVDPGAGKWEVVTSFPGYTRGLAFLGSYAFVGLSRIRETSVFGGLPIAEKRNELKCGLGVVDLRTGRQVAAFQFVDGIEEIFDVQALPSVRCPLIRGPEPKDVATDEIWVSPPPPPELRT